MLTDLELAQARAMAASTMQATVTVTNPGSAGGWDPNTGPIDGTPAKPIYTGPARVQAVRTRASDANQPDAVGQGITANTYKVALPYDAPAPAVGATITVDAHTDARLAGKRLTVGSVVFGDLAVERVLYAVLDLTNQPTGGA